MNKVSEKLKNFIIEQAMISKSTIIEWDSVVETDFGITGDDADDFVYSFSKAFNVDVSKFDIGLYFGGEGTNFFNLFKKKSKQPRKILTVGMLQKSIESGVLNDNLF